MTLALSEQGRCEQYRYVFRKGRILQVMLTDVSRTGLSELGWKVISSNISTTDNSAVALV